MGAVAYLLLVVLAGLISAQLLVLMDRGVPLRKRLREFGVGGDATFLLVTVLLMGSTVGAFAGYFLGATGVGATIGLAVGVTGWLVGAAWSFGGSRRGRFGGR
ncbi:hypothetical protein AB0L70_00515 [Kribbella sp. NPDC051952]|uniref:hypothetical protein n=1 Tax=Kribbella sp. NPDC051952 TaxID=3154851 RepID=UPI003435824E